MRKALWRLAHRLLPCWALHAACSACRAEDLCPRCIDEAFAQGQPADVIAPSWLTLAVGTYGSGSTVSLTCTL